ncbi:conserved hypothetical protein [Xanthobacter versatilis]|uniref:Gene transfer agent family protein n=1 Tax=Xanthobacter autotrophicus (strain ATCC BAA-1158 / Py2) TaxID=78245 RepID=A7ILP8_XANP2|nr:conserved hypothetical protein [Xanthobacter autotrophicus Py2]
MPANPGEVEVTLDGKAFVLRSTLRAAKEVSASAGGFIGAYQRLAAFDFSTYVAIVAAGLGKRSSDVEDAVYATGIAPLSAPLSRFVQLLANGGKEPEEPKGLDDEEGTSSGEA